MSSFEQNDYFPGFCAFIGILVLVSCVVVVVVVVVHLYSASRSAGAESSFGRKLS